MKQQLLCLIAAACSITAGAQSIGPSTLNSAGNSSNIASDTYEWSVGEMAVVTTYASGTLVVTQGTLQPSDAALGIGDNERIAKHLHVFPNPAQDEVFLQPEFSPGSGLTYTLQTIDGKAVSTHNVQLAAGNEKQSLKLNALAAGTYVLLVQLVENGQTIISNYKIEKLH